MQARAAEVAYVAADPFVRKVTINKGSRQGIVQGAPVIDGRGLLGQVVRVHPLSSEVLLLDNPQQAVPVLNSRTGERSLVYGDARIRAATRWRFGFYPIPTMQVGDTIEQRCGRHLPRRLACRYRVCGRTAQQQLFAGAACASGADAVG